jgi:GGDEF domain-containing protein
MQARDIPLELRGVEISNNRLFKNVSYEHGHAVGDKILIQFERIINENIRQQAKLARRGCVEFILLCCEVLPHKEKAQLYF